MNIRRNTRCWLLVLALATFATPAMADAAADAIAAAVAAPERSAEDRERDAAEKPMEVLTFFGVRPGMRVADIMTGGGYYAEILARVVGPATEVIALNNAPYTNYAGEALDQRLEGGRLPNVRVVKADLEDMGLGSNTLDMVLMVMSYHDIHWESDDWPRVDTAKFFDQLYSAVRPGGIVAIVDHHAAPGTGTSMIDALHRIDSEFARRDFEGHGFVLEAESDLLRNPADDHTLGVFDDAIRHHTDRFIYRFRKPLP